MIERCSQITSLNQSLLWKNTDVKLWTFSSSRLSRPDQVKCVRTSVSHSNLGQFTSHPSVHVSSLHQIRSQVSSHERHEQVSSKVFEVTVSQDTLCRFLVKCDVTDTKSLKSWSFLKFFKSIHGTPVQSSHIRSYIKSQASLTGLRWILKCQVVQDWITRLWCHSQWVQI